MPLRVFAPRVLRPVAVATVGHARGFMLITQQHPPYTLRSWSKALIPSASSSIRVDGSAGLIDGNFKSSAYSRLIPLDQRR